MAKKNPCQTLTASYSCRIQMTQISTANHQEKSIMRIATRLLACSLGLLAVAQLQAQTNVVSDPVGFYKVALTATAPHGAVSTISAGSSIEIRKLTSIKDLFGYPNTILNYDTSGNQSILESDVIRYVNGTSFGAAVTYFTNAPFGGYFLS